MKLILILCCVFEKEMNYNERIKMIKKVKKKEKLAFYKDIIKTVIYGY